MSGPTISVGLKSHDVKDVSKLFAEWPDRFRRLRSQILYYGADYALHQIQSRIPNRKELQSYSLSLTVARLVGIPATEDGFAVIINPRSSRVRKVDAAKTVLYVKARRPHGRVPGEVQVLSQFNPWTLDTLPFTPDKRHALVVSRKVSKSEVTKVANLRRQDRPIWRQALIRAGVRRIPSLNNQLVTRASRGLGVMPDVAQDGYRLEFGLGKDRAKSHWKVSILKLKRRGFQEIRRRKWRQIRKTLLDSGFQGWKRWPLPRIRTKLKVGEARKFKIFQKRLAIRGR